MPRLPLLEEVTPAPSPETMLHGLRDRPGVVVLHSALQDTHQARYSFIAARPFLTFHSHGSRCVLQQGAQQVTQFGNPWHCLNDLLARYEQLEEMDLPFPLGGCFGFWGYDLRHFVEPRLTRRASRDLDLPDCWVGFYGSLLALDHQLGKTWIIASGLEPDGSRSPQRAIRERDRWRRRLENVPGIETCPFHTAGEPGPPRPILSSLTRATFLERVRQAQEYIRLGHIYQVNLAQRLTAPLEGDAWDFHRRLTTVSPAPFAAWINPGPFQIVSSSPERFLHLSGSRIQTRPIKGTRPRSPDLDRDAQLSYELQTSRKEMAELIMITDLLRNDLGRVCEFGSVRVPELARLEKYPQVQHLVSTIEGILSPGTTHFQALASCFPGGSITGAPKIRSMDLIDELEPVTRGPYTGCAGYLGFNRESQVNILIRTAVCLDGQVHFHAGAGIVADSEAEAEYEETLAKAGGFLNALRLAPRPAQQAASSRQP